MTGARIIVCAVLALLMACSGGVDGDVQDGDLEVVVVTGPESPARYEVRCGPSGGTTPDPEATCAAIAGHPEMLSPPS